MTFWKPPFMTVIELPYAKRQPIELLQNWGTLQENWVDISVEILHSAWILIFVPFNFGCVMIQLLHFQLYIFNLGCSTFIFSTYYNLNFWIFNFSQNQPKCFQLWKFSTFCLFNFWQIQLFLFQLQLFPTYIITTSISAIDSFCHFTNKIDRKPPSLGIQAMLG